MRIDDLLMARLGGGAVQGMGDPATRVMLYAANSVQPNQVPQADPYATLWRRALIEKSTADLYTGVNGYWLGQLPWVPYTIKFERGLFTINTNPAPKNASPLDIVSGLEEFIPTIDDLIAMRRRGFIDDQGLRILARSRGIIPGNMLRLLDMQSMQIPPPSDLIRMAVREVFNPQLRADLKLDDEFAQQTEYQDWARAQGIGFAYMRTEEGKLISRDFARDYWAAHWQLPSPGQGYEMLYRLRPNRVAKWAVNVPGIQPFTLDSLRTLLKAQDYSPAWRDNLAAISYRLPGRIDLRRMFQAGQIGRDELVESYLDLGYGTVDAGRLADYAVFLKENRLSRFDLGRLLRRRVISNEQYLARMEQQGYTRADATLMAEGNTRQVTPGMVLRWYRKNVINRVVAVSRLVQTGYSDADAERIILEIDTDRQRRVNAPAVDKIKEAWRIGAIMSDRAKELLKRLGLSDNEIDAFSADWNAQTRIDSVRAALRRIRRQYLSGYINVATAREQLGTMGIVDTMREIYIARWEAELGPNRRELSAQQVVDALKRGLISVLEARRRLSILGYDEQTGSILLLSAEQDRQTAAARAAIAASRTVKEQQAAAKAAVKEADAAKRRAINDMARHGSPATLMRWVQRNIISPDQARARLQELYWPERDINAWITEALQKRHEWLAKGVKAATGEVQPPEPRNLTHPIGPVL